MTYTWIYHTPDHMDDLFMNSDGEYLTGLWFENSPDCKKHDQNGTKKLLPVFIETCNWLDQYFQGEKPERLPPCKINNLTPFRKEVLEILKTIPFGKTMTYKEIADRIASNRGINKMSAQAVGQAVGWNPIGIIIPCHRVVGKSGHLTGYGGGIKNKYELLKHENHDMSQYFYKNS